MISNGCDGDDADYDYDAGGMMIKNGFSVYVQLSKEEKVCSHRGCFFMMKISKPATRCKQKPKDHCTRISNYSPRQPGHWWWSLWWKLQLILPLKRRRQGRQGWGTRPRPRNNEDGRLVVRMIIGVTVSEVDDFIISTMVRMMIRGFTLKSRLL